MECVRGAARGEEGVGEGTKMSSKCMGRACGM